MSGLFLQRVDVTDDHIARLATRWRRVGLDGVRADLSRRMRSTRAPGRAVERAWRFDGPDQLDLRWWPQGVSTAADAGLPALGDSRTVLVSWYAKKQPWHDAHHGSRVSVLDLDTERYRHVLLVVPTAEGGVRPLQVHAGGIVWYGDHLHVAATGKGFFTCRLDDVLRVPEDSGAETLGYRYVLPVWSQYRARTDTGVERFRYSFLSLDHGAHPPAVLAGEYTNDPGRTRRLARFALDPSTGLLETGADDRAVVTILGDGPRRMQGVVAARGRLYVTVSQGRFVRGSVFAGTPDDLREHRHATPMGNEDVAYWPDQDLLYSVSEHPTARWLFAMRPDSFA